MCYLFFFIYPYLVVYVYLFSQIDNLESTRQLNDLYAKFSKLEVAICMCNAYIFLCKYILCTHLHWWFILMHAHFLGYRKLQRS